MAFVRPEAAATWNTWKQVIFGGLIAAVGLWIIITWFGLSKLGGGIIVLMGALIVLDGYRRIKFPHGSGGLGLVQIDERQILYMSGQGGGSISIETLERVEVHRNAKGRITWVFYSNEEMLEVPGDAKGTDQLFDALVALPGVNYAQASAAVEGQGPDLFLIWQKDRTKLH